MLTRLLPAWVPIAVFALLAFVILGQEVRVSNSKARTARAETMLADTKAQYADAARRAEAAARSEEQRRADAVRKVVNDAQTQTAAARADAARASASADRLRQRTAELASRSCSAGDPAAPDGGKAAAEAADLFAYMQRRVGEAQRGTVEFADGAGIAGAACERAYDGLQPGHREP